MWTTNSNGRQQWLNMARLVAADWGIQFLPNQFVSQCGRFGALNKHTRHYSPFVWALGFVSTIRCALKRAVWLIYCSKCNSKLVEKKLFIRSLRPEYPMTRWRRWHAFCHRMSHQRSHLTTLNVEEYFQLRSFRIHRPQYRNWVRNSVRANRRNYNLIIYSQPQIVCGRFTHLGFR